MCCIVFSDHSDAVESSETRLLMEELDKLTSDNLLLKNQKESHIYFIISNIFKSIVQPLV